MRTEILRMENIITDELERLNLNNFNLHIYEGEIMGLIGINEQGKDILLELITRNIPIKFGRVFFCEKLVNSYQRNDNSYNKVYIIGQTSRLIGTLSVVENVFVIRNGFKKVYVNIKVLAKQLEILMQDIGVYIDPYRLCANLSEYDRCIVELLKAMIQQSKLVIFNDLINIFSVNDILAFHRLIKALKEKMTFIYIGDHHEDVFLVCDRVALMENGKISKVFNKKEMDFENMIPYITLSNNVSSEKRKYTDIFCQFEHIFTENINDLNVSIALGECVVLYDKSNSIQKDFAKILKGEKGLFEGLVTCNGKIISNKKRKKWIYETFGIIGEDPLKSMIFYDMSYIKNLSFLIDRKIATGIISKNVKRSIIKEYYADLGDDILADNLHKLSKKSLYNLVYYRILLLNPKIVVVVQPFLNADMYLRQHILRLIGLFKEKKIAVILLTSNIFDSIYEADKILLLENGTVTNCYDSDMFDQIKTMI